MSISELIRYWNEGFQSEIFSSDIGITDVDVGCRISLTLRLMSMPTCAYRHLPFWSKTLFTTSPMLNQQFPGPPITVFFDFSTRPTSSRRAFEMVSSPVLCLGFIMAITFSPLHHPLSISLFSLPT